MKIRRSVSLGNTGRHMRVLLTYCSGLESRDMLSVNLSVDVEVCIGSRGQRIMPFNSHQTVSRYVESFDTSKHHYALSCRRLRHCGTLRIQLLSAVALCLRDICATSLQLANRGDETCARLQPTWNAAIFWRYWSLKYYHPKSQTFTYPLID